MRETEITVQIFNELAEIDGILKAQGFEMIETYRLKDWYFSKIEDAKRVEYADLLKQSFLIRSVGDKAQLCYKNKEIDEGGIVISEEKTETEIGDLDKAIAVFQAAGLNNYCIVENESYVYQRGATSFVVQVIKDLGTFLEYEEEESMRGLSAREKLSRLIESANDLGLRLGKDYSCKKVYMLLKKNG